ncbi:hypothetical protein FG386_003694 [Cryptosporidium ryanae]|uniref:uncharacterized protein n=1 Tax=Cryptosporidium ryanae TaxID=515981 RepID=UPI00351A00A6|nr:hypothetical protein FG386_003694 [Cryptosporidium ryanae]
MDSDTSIEKPSRRKVLRKQSLEIKALKEEWKKALNECKKKGSKKEVDKEYKCKLENLELAHKIELMKLSTNEVTAEILNKEKESNGNSYYEQGEIQSIYKNNTEKITKGERRRRKKQRGFELEHLKLMEEYSLNSDKIAEIELNTINEKLKELKLKLFNISPDGNCLFGSIKHQLDQKDIGTYSIKDLRRIAVEYIEQNKETMEQFVLASIENSDTSFEKYCENIRDTNEWGGEVELVALSNSLKIPITVIRSLNHRNEYYGEHFHIKDGTTNGNTLFIVYHMHLFANGPHYNSTTEVLNV